MLKSFEGLPLLSCTLGQWEKIFQVLEAEALKTLIILSEGISVSEGGVVNMTKRTVNFNEPTPKEMSLRGEEYTIAFLHKWNHCDQKEKIILCE